MDACFFEAVGYPEDEDDPASVAAITADIGRFATCLVRLANASLLAVCGTDETGLHEQLVKMIEVRAPCDGASWRVCWGRERS